ncbi:hypothetical protein [Ligilactobacillus animalis]|uniref:hypothetical protein n=1 Tax=Ligilactobacillus animalis TaxID=1605 RepID=UPI00259478C8|nr:hypothetical protein [Ligilactobacillus animalis]
MLAIINDVALNILKNAQNLAESSLLSSKSLSMIITELYDHSKEVLQKLVSVVLGSLDDYLFESTLRKNWIVKDQRSRTILTEIG